jgi:hypothetical protein
MGASPPSSSPWSPAPASRIGGRCLLGYPPFYCNYILGGLLCAKVFFFEKVVCQSLVALKWISLEVSLVNCFLSLFSDFSRYFCLPLLTFRLWS